VGIDALPPPASGLPTRLVLGPALRAQSDRRLVRLVREGYESAFEEIVRRYRRPLDRFAAGIVGGRSEDVTQDSFRKALEALRHGDSEVELRPWLYRIVRNTALNDLRDRPPAAAELADELVGGGRSAAAEAEERAEVAALVTRLRALPENQRAALVMRELEGMSHEEIAAALDISHGAARQAIARARTTVRSGFGALVPLPLLRALASGGGVEAAGGAGAVGAAAGSGAAIGSGSVLGSGAAAVSGGIGAGAVLKVGLATVAVAGSIGAGVAIDHHGGGHRAADPPRAVASAPGGPNGETARSTLSPFVADVDDSHGSGRGGDDNRGHDGGGHRGGDDKHHDRDRGGDHGSSGGHRGGGDDRRDHRGRGGGDDEFLSSPVIDQPAPTVAGDDHGGRSRGGSGSGGHGSDGSGSSGDGRSDSGASRGSGSGGGGSGHGGSGGSGSGRGGGGNGSGGSGSGHGSASSGSGDASSNSGSGSGSSNSSRGGPGSGDATETVVGTGTAATPSLDGSGSSSSGSGSSGSSGGSESSGGSDSSSSDGGSSSDSGSSGDS
jgi:RNA polymerase sigma factor (sigma-70 family)